MSPEETQARLEGPGLERPPGVAPGPLNQGQHALGYGLVIFPAILCALAVVVRLASRISMNRVGIEDILIVCALAFFAGEAYSIYSVSIFPGLLIHQWDVQLKYLSHVQYHIHIGSIFYGLVVMCLKIAILKDWLRLFVPRGQRNWLFWTFHALIWANIIYYGSGTLIEVWRCHPRQKIWDPLFEGGSCPIDIGANNFVSGIVNIASDFAILLLPQWVIWNLHISKPKRVGVSMLFVIGLFACICATIRLVYLVRLMLSLDITYYLSHVVLWGVGETTVGFLILGIPSVPTAIKIMPFAGSINSLLKSFRRTTETNPYPPQRSWPRSTPRKKRDPWEITDLDTYDLIATTPMGAESGDEQRHGSITQPESIFRQESHANSSRSPPSPTSRLDQKVEPSHC